EHAFRAWLARRFAQERLRNAHVGEFAALLRQVAVPDATAAATVGFVEAVDHARYAPVPPDATARRELLERARRLVDQLDALGSKQKQRSRTTVATLAAVAAFGAAAHATSAQQPARITQSMAPPFGV